MDSNEFLSKSRRARQQPFIHIFANSVSPLLELLSAWEDLTRFQIHTISNLTYFIKEIMGWAAYLIPIEVGNHSQIHILIYKIA